MVTLYIVGTPIGNLEDITLRALRVLGEVDAIACEDTRVTRKLLAHYNIEKPLITFHEHSRLVNLGKYESVAYVSDAGTPGLSDPGAMLVAHARKQGAIVVPVPGPSALGALVSVSGIPLYDFVFLGFLPHKKGRETLLREIASSKRPVIVHESTHRLTKLFAKLPPDRHVIVGRELTKKFEEVWQGDVLEARTYFAGDHARGEFVLLVLPE